jgi:endogenous inhibitor of DNA gyrase (YacG/DUF329 family)
MGETIRLRPRRPCPLCGKPSKHRYPPFCSVRCADIDLSKWLGGNYAIPPEEAEAPGAEVPLKKEEE